MDNISLVSCLQSNNNDNNNSIVKDQTNREYG